MERSNNRNKADFPPLVSCLQESERRCVDNSTVYRTSAYCGMLVRRNRRELFKERGKSARLVN